MKQISVLSWKRMKRFRHSQRYIKILSVEAVYIFCFITPAQIDGQYLGVLSTIVYITVDAVYCINFYNNFFVNMCFILLKKIWLNGTCGINNVYYTSKKLLFQACIYNFKCPKLDHLALFHYLYFGFGVFVAVPFQIDTNL